VRLLTDVEPVIEQTVALLPIFCVSLVGDGVNLALQALLRGSGRQKVGGHPCLPRAVEGVPADERDCRAGDIVSWYSACSTIPYTSRTHGRKSLMFVFVSCCRPARSPTLSHTVSLAALPLVCLCLLGALAMPVTCYLHFYPLAFRLAFGRVPGHPPGSLPGV
jgi:hypothetical protein